MRTPRILVFALCLSTALAAFAAETAKYVSSKNSDVFHRPECRIIEQMKVKNLVGYTSKGEAMSAGKKKCEICKP